MRTSVSKGLVAAGLVLGTLGVVVEPAAADGGTIEVPELVVTAIGEDIDFNGTPDPYSGWLRKLEITGGTEPQPCDHGTEPDDGVLGALDGCFSVQIDPSVGEITIVGTSGFLAPGGAELAQDALPTTGPINISGTRDEVNAALAALRWVAPDDYESSAGNDPAFLTVFATDGDEDPIAFENEDDEPFLDGGGNPVSPMQIEIRAEHSPNEGPDLTIDVQTQPFPVVASTTASTVDDEVVLSNFDGNGTDEFADDVFFEDPDLDDDEADDYALFAVWLDPADPADANFSLAAFAGTDCMYESLEQFLTQAPGEPCTVIEEPFAVNFEEQMFSGLLPTGLSFGTDIANERAVLFLARYASGEDPEDPDNSTAENILSRIEFYPPQEDCDCTLSVLVHDLGNNGLPLPNLEKGVLLPDLLGLDFEAIDFEVRDAENDPPVVTASPAGPTAVDEGASTPVSFTVTDPDAADDCDLAIDAVTVVGGTLSPLPTVGTTGSATELTAGLQNLQFTANEFTNHPGAGSVTIGVTDNGCGPAADPPGASGQATATFVVDEDGQPDSDPNTEANDPPVLTTPASISVIEGVAFDLADGDVDLADPDAAGDDLTLTITPTGGTTNADGPNAGTVAELDALLDGLTFTADQDVDVDDETLTPGITLTVTDNGHNPVNPFVEGTDSAMIDVAVADDDGDVDPEVNDPPVILGPTDETATEGVALALGDFTVTDPDVGAGTMDLVIGVDPAAGTVSSPGGAGLTLAEVNTILDGLTFTPAQDADFDDEIDVAVGIAVDDNGNSGSGGQLSDLHVVLVDVTDDDEPPVNDPPVITGPVATGADETVATALGDFTVTDPDVGAGLMDVTISVPAGTGSLSSTGQSGIDLAAVNALLDALTFTPVADADLDNEAVDITITVDDNGNTGTGGELSDTHVVAVTVFDVDAPQPPNDPPVLVGPTAGAATEGVPFAFDDFTVTDPDVDDGDGLLDLTLTSPVGAGTFSSASASGLTLAQVNSLLDDLTFTPAEDDADSTDETFQLTITVNDRGNFGTGGALADDLVIEMTVADDDATNQAPTLTGPGAQVVVTGGVIAFTGPLAITVDDPDAAANDLLLQIDVAGAGDVTAAAVPDTIGTLAELQAVLDALVFTAGAPGAATITIVVNDQGATGTGGAQTDTLVIPVTVTAQATTTTSTSTTTTTPGGGTATSTTAAVGAGGAGRGGTSLPRTGADLLLLAGAAVTLAGLGGLLTSRRPRARA